METISKTPPAFLLTGDLKSDPKFNTPPQSLSTLKRWRWWIGNYKWYALSLLKRKLTGWKYTQEKSLQNYQSADVNQMEHDWFFNDRLRHMIQNNNLVISYQSNSTKVRIQYLLNELKEIEGLKTILDFGCGGGINFVNIAKNLPGIQVHGFDYTPTRIEFARKLCAQLGLSDANLSVADGRKLSFPDKSFDATFTCQVLEQIDADAELALREMGRVTRKKIILIEPALEMGNLTQKLYIYHQGYLRNLPEKIARVLQDWKVVKRELLPTFSNPLEPIAATVLVPNS
jgi:ubiquinone/menaquinone biosynthesis C-methylase UbiE